MSLLISLAGCAGTLYNKVIPIITWRCCLEKLKQRILKDGQNLGGGILKVDGFINHQVDPELMDACGREFAKLFKNVGATKVLTAEISGIAPAIATALHLKLPVV